MLQTAEMDGIDELDNPDDLIERLKEIDERCNMNAAIQPHLVGTAAKKLDMSSDLKWIEDLWLGSFGKLNNVMLYRTSISDILFMLYCKCWARMNIDKLRVGVGDNPVTDCLSLQTSLAIASSKHGSLSPTSRASDEVVSDLFLRMVKYHEQHMKYGIPRVEQHLMQLKLTDDDFKQHSYSAEGVKEILDLIWMDVERAKIFLKKKEDEKDEEPYKLSSKGWLWAEDADDVMKRFIPLASRFFYQQFIQDRLWSSAEVVVCQPCSVRIANRIQGWFKDKTIIDYSALNFPLVVRNTVMEFQLPLGARQHPKRDPNTRYDSHDASTLIENEIGNDFTTWLARSIEKHKYAQIANDQEHELYQVLLLCMVNYFMLQDAIIDMIKTCFIFPEKLTPRSFSTKRIMKSTRRPIMSFLKNQWIIHNWIDPHTNKAQWLVCPDVPTMLSRWFTLLRNDYSMHLDHGIALTPEWIVPVFVQL